MKETSVRKKLNEQGYALRKKNVPIAEVGGEVIKEARYAIVDQNNCIVTGEFDMTLDEVVAWLKQG